MRRSPGVSGTPAARAGFTRSFYTDRRTLAARGLPFCQVEHPDLSVNIGRSKDPVMRLTRGTLEVARWSVGCSLEVPWAMRPSPSTRKQETQRRAGSPGCGN